MRTELARFHVSRYYPVSFKHTIKRTGSGPPSHERMKHKFKLVDGHPRLWIRPRNLPRFKRESQGPRAGLRKKVLQKLETVLADPPSESFKHVASPHELALALGQAWQLTRDEKYPRAAWRVLEALEPYVASNPGYAAWGNVAEAAAICYDWCHDCWKKSGLLQEVATAASICGRRALDDLFTRYILDDWHNYAVGLQSGALSVALALGREHPRLEDGSMLKTLEKIHFTGLPYSGLRIQDMHSTPPTTMNLSATLAGRGGTGGDCLWESAGAYHVIDARVILKMAELWSNANAVPGAEIVWPELSQAGDAILHTMRPDGQTMIFGDAHPQSFYWRMADVLTLLHARAATPVFAEQLREWNIERNHPFPIFQLLCAPPDTLSATNGAKAAKVPALPLAHRAGRLALLRSGWTSDDTFVSFSCGEFGGWHNHLDFNTFTIFRGSELAVDFAGCHYAGTHRQEWHGRTVAHNGILVRDPKEKSWKGRNGLPVSNDGGQRLVSLTFAPPHRRTGTPNPVLTQERRTRLSDQFDMGKLVAFEPGDSFDYLAGDATRAYTYPWSGIGDNPARRVEEAVRQIVFLKPDFVIVFDRVEATRPEFIKSWLLHTHTPAAWFADNAHTKAGDGIVALPESGPYEFEHGDGRMTVWPLLPSARAVRSVGGAGYECWIDDPASKSGGKNYGLDAAQAGPPHWRIEVSPTTRATRHCFLTVIHAGLTKHAPARNDYECSVAIHDGQAECRIVPRGKKISDAIARIKFREAGPLEVEVNIPGECAYHRNAEPARVPTPK
jgi:hypothetical protein